MLVTAYTECRIFIVMLRAVVPIVGYHKIISLSEITSPGQNSLAYFSMIKEKKVFLL
jgi:hypothetical protein